MSTENKIEFAELIIQLREEFPTRRRFEIAEFAAKLTTITSLFQRIQIKKCNEELKLRDIEKEQIWRKDILELCLNFDIKVDLSGDPRGYVVKLVLPSGRSNTMGGEGWGVVCFY